MVIIKNNDDGHDGDDADGDHDNHGGHDFHDDYCDDYISMLLPFFGHPRRSLISSIAFDIAVNTVETSDKPIEIYRTRRPHKDFSNADFGACPWLGTRSPNPIVAKATKQ